MKRANFITIPFKMEAHQGLSQVDGLAKISVAGIVLEFETKFLGLVNTGVKEVRLPLEEITSIVFKKGFFRIGGKIEIRMSTFLKLSELPNKDGKIVLKIPRDQHADAKLAAELLTRHLYFDELPPPQMPVGDLFETDELVSDDFETNKLNKPE